MGSKKHITTTLMEFVNTIEYKEHYKQYRPSENNIIVNAFSEPDDEGNLTVRIDSLIVPTYQRHKNFGRHEVERIISWAREIKAKYIVIESLREVIGFWKKMGFEIDDQGEDVSTGILRLSNKNELYFH